VTRIYLEGGGDSKELHTRCREGFAKLLTRMGFTGRMPRLVACGGRGAAYDDFRTAMQGRAPSAWVGLWVDSEEPMADLEAAWEHLGNQDRWDRPAGASDDDVLLMVTCMETWLVADRDALAKHYGPKLHAKALPSLHDLETRDRHAAQDALEKATVDCTNPYRKGKRSFALLAAISPDEVGGHCPSFVRCRRVLQEKL